MYIKIKLPLSAKTMQPMASARPSLERQLTLWAETMQNITYTTEQVGTSLIVRFDCDSAYSLWALTWNTGKLPRWLQYTNMRIVEDCTEKVTAE